MICSNCQATNPEGAKFCANCGRPLAALCPSCGAPASADARFCNNCGHALAGAPAEKPAPGDRLRQYIPAELLAKLEASRAAGGPTGERRVVTVLFGDVQGSTALAESLDPEEWAEIMNGAFEHLIAPVYRYEGTVARLMGDGILAFFGAPIAHEDDPRRAILAALDILDEMQSYSAQVARTYGQQLQVRVGINTGLVVVGEVGSDLRVEYTAMGDAVNVASRLEQTAAPGTVRISGNTYRHVRSLFDVEPLGSLEIKGKSEPVDAYRVILAREGSVPTRGIEGLTSPLVGRDAEMASLRARLDDLDAGRGGIVSVMGEAGLGKTRLVAELRAAREEPAAIHWLEGRSFSYQTSTPYAPFVSMLTGLFELGGAAGNAYQHLTARVEKILPQAAAETVPFLATMLDLALPAEDAELVRHLEPPQLRSRVFAAVRDLLAGLAADRPLVLQLEDLHWADPTSLDLVEYLLPLTEQLPVLVIALFRPHQDEPSWRFHQLAESEYAHRYAPLCLEPLAEDDSRALVANLLHIEDLPERVRALILQKSEGNPFYVEEVIRSLLDTGLVVRENERWHATREIETVAVPDTLSGVITARLDRLSEESRRTAQAASVVGREFEVDIVEDVYEMPSEVLPALSDLQRREIVQERSRTASRLFSFKHVLTQETAYSSILLSRRRELHRRTGESLERRDASRVSEIAQHFLQAREATRALPYLVATAERLARAYSMPEAIDTFERCLLTPESGHDTQLARRIYEGLGYAQTLTNDIPGAAQTFDAMHRDATERGDIPMTVSALNKRAMVRAMYLGQFMEAEQDLAEAEQLARGHGDAGGLVETATIRCGTCLPTASFDRAIDSLGSSIEAARQLDLKGQLAQSLAHAALTRAWMAEFRAAWELAQECLDVTAEIGDLAKRGEVLTFPIPICLVQWGDLEAAWQAAGEGTATADRVGDMIHWCAGLMMQATIARLRGQWDAAIEKLEQCLAILTQLGGPAMLFTPGVMTSLDAIYRDVSPELHAATAGSRALPTGEAEEMAGASAWADMGFAALTDGALDRAAELFERGLTRPSMSWLIERPRLLVGSALLALTRGRPDEAERLMREAREFTEQREMRCMMPLLDLADGQVAAAHGNVDGSLALLARSEEAACRMEMRPLVLRAQMTTADLLAAVGRDEEAERKRSEAGRTIQDIAAQLQNEDIRAAFLAGTVGDERTVGEHGQTSNIHR